MYVGKKFSIVFLVLIAVVWIMNDFRLIAEVYNKDSISPLFFVPAYIIAFFTAGSLLLYSVTWVRTIIQILLFSSLYTDILYVIIGDFPFSFPDAINLINNPEYAPGAFMTFMTALLLAFAATAVVYGVIHLVLIKVPKSHVPASAFLFLAMQLSIFVLSTKYTGIYDFFPSMYRVAGNLISANSFKAEEHWRRATVQEQPGNRKVKHVFIVVDESVTGNALSVNGFSRPTSPFLQSNADQFINFGTATSFTNFSAGSNLSLMSGMLTEELPDRKFNSFARPGIFQYARKAGYQTYLLDAQTNGKKLQNYTTTKDLAYIDSLFKPGSINPAAPSYRRDSLLVEKIVSIAASDQPTFSYVNKAGAHWPYHTNVPRDSLDNRFVFLRSEAENAATYFRSLFWNVDKFWRMLIKKLPENSEVLIVYTSDHGENYAADPARIKHASIYNTPAVEGLVPLLALDRANFFPDHFSPVLNRYSHQYIFPTLLLAMGYHQDFVGRKYGKSLLDPPYLEPRWFHAGDLFGRGKTRRVFVDEN